MARRLPFTVWSLPQNNPHGALRPWVNFDHPAGLFGPLKITVLFQGGEKGQKVPPGKTRSGPGLIDGHDFPGTKAPHKFPPHIFQNLSIPEEGFA
jgi:hypothetical protein